MNIKSETTKYPFPFLGAGIGRYEEYRHLLKLYIKFRKEPDAISMKKIKDSSPIPFNDSDDEYFGAAFSGSFLMLENIKHIHKHIFSQYEAIEAFENAIIDWLLDVHTYSPIELVFRPLYETKELSDWHKYSCDLIPEMILYLEDSGYSAVNNPQGFGNDWKAWRNFRFLNRMKAVLVEYHKPENFHNWSDEKQQENKDEIKASYPSFYACHITEGWYDGEEFIELINQYEDDSRLLTDFAGCITEAMLVYGTQTDSSGLSRDGFDEVYKCLMDSSAEIPLKAIEQEQLYNELVKAFSNNDINLVRMVAERIWSFGYLKGAVVWFGFYEPALIQLLPPKEKREKVMMKVKHSKEQWETFLNVFDFIMDTVGDESIDRSFYCNALFACTTGNTGLPVNIPRNRKFLKYCLESAYMNYTTYYNAGCVYNNMGEYDKAFECFKQYFDKRTEKEYKDERKAFIAELRETKEFAAFREHEGVGEFISKIK